MTRKLIIALLAVFLPGSLAPEAVLTRVFAMTPQTPFVVSLRAMPAMSRPAVRSARRQIAAQPVRGLYITCSCPPRSLVRFEPDSRLRKLPLFRHTLKRAPPAVA
ncbi:MAG: hypothetical protein GYA63_02530 [Armatimonadetes bacterium]|nr:hypothetical protein [Armatimonadota bacterium]HOC31919.1 hypothetical protein [Armatimonadota bacterium]